MENRPSGHTDNDRNDITLPKSVLSRLKIIEDVPGFQEPKKEKPKEIPDQTVMTAESPTDDHAGADAAKKEKPAENGKISEALPDENQEKTREDIQAGKSVSDAEAVREAKNAALEKELLKLKNREDEKEQKPTVSQSSEQPQQVHNTAAEVMSWKDVLERKKKALQFDDLIISLMNAQGDEDEVQKAVGRYCEQTIAYTLKCMPVEELNFRKAGIRVGALRSAGYTNIYSIRNMSYGQFLNIHGIGEKSAMLISRELSALCTYVGQSVEIHPREGDGISDTAVKACYQRFEYTKLRTQAQNSLSLVHRDLQARVNEIGSSGLSWALTSNDKKTAMAAAARDLDRIISPQIQATVTALMGKRNQIGNVSSHTCFEAYRNASESYDYVFDSCKRTYLTGYSEDVVERKERYDAGIGDAEPKGNHTGCLVFLVIAIIIFILVKFG